MDRDEWLSDQIDEYYHHYGKDMDDDRLEWLEYIYDTCADDEGYIDWTRTMDPDDAWYILMSEVYGMSDAEIEKYLD